MRSIYANQYDDPRRALCQLDWNVVAFDAETDGTNWYSMNVHTISVCDGNNNVVIQVTPENLPVIKEYLNKAVLLIGYNIIYDAKALLKLGIDVFDKEWYCCQVAEHVLNEQHKYLGLKALAEKYFGVTTKSWKDVKHNTKSKEFLDYALQDTELTWKLFVKQKSELQETEQTSLVRDIEMPFQKAVARMEMNGIAVNQSLLGEKTAYAEQKVFQLKTHFLKQAGKKTQLQFDLLGNSSVVSDFNIDSNEHVGNYLFDELGCPVISKTETGRPQVNREVLEKLQEYHPSVKTLLEYRTWAKLHNAFLEPLPSHINPDGRVRPHFRTTGTATGRLSCAEPNLQQLPRPNRDPGKIRELFKASNGYKIITCDYSGQELRVLAHISKDPTLIDIFCKNKDLHLATAKQFYELPIPEEALFADHPEYDKYKSEYSKERSQAKVISFGIAYGKGAYGFAKDFNISEEEAQKILDNYFAGFPGIKRAMDETREFLNKHGYVVSMTGRRRYFPQEKDKWGRKYYSNRSHRQAFNFLIQGYSADMIRLATLETEKLIKQHPQWSLRMIASVHDENVYEVKQEYLTEASAAIKQCFEQAVQLLVPTVSDVGVGDTYYEAK